MKILTQNIQSNSFRSLANNLQMNNEFAVVNDINNLAKALNDFMPHLLILEPQNVTGLVKAFCDKNNVKIIAFGNNRVEDVDLFISDQQGFAELSVLSYKTDDDKIDVSIFLDDASQQLYASFLCQNYNVKSYGQAKLNSPKYLGVPTSVEQFEVLNKSKLSVVFNEQDKYASALLGCCPSVARHVPVAISHILRVVSHEPETNHVPSGLTATPVTQSVWPSSVRSKTAKGGVSSVIVSSFSFARLPLLS